MSQNRPDNAAPDNATPNSAARRALKQKRMEAERMQDVLLLLEDLFRAQESTIKLIFDRLYDVGSVHLIDQRLSARLLNQVTKAIAPGAKPVFRAIGFLWFRKKCPAMIANWLYKKVASNQSLPTLIQELEAAELRMASQLQAEPPSGLPPAKRQTGLAVVEQPNQEIRRLRSQVQFLLGALVGTVMLLGSTTLWLMRDSAPLLLRPINPSTTACLGDGSCREAAAETGHALESR